ncbi:MAG: hypothetical protein IRZ33_10930, partial [Alicyclobacillaceae bacterium]|nr:hypothetical protein [Alicyclobacillaceae bacterium]
ITSTGRVGAIVGPLLLGVFLQSGTPVSTMIYIYSLPLLVGAIIAVLLIRSDTRRKSLEEIEELVVFSADPTTSARL